MDKAFFANSGAEANEAAIKLVRKYWSLRDKPGCEIIVFRNSFHGRTLAALDRDWSGKIPPGISLLWYQVLSMLILMTWSQYVN
ncbi:MAG: aminotransferase class III-fold pyridoxal phosphate-dependent enzyme [Syntrophothermaceae bacterium]